MHGPLPDEHTLCVAIGLARDRAPEVAARLEAIGGLFGLWSAGAEALEGLLDRERAERLEAVLSLASRAIAPPVLADAIDGAAAVAAYFRPRLATSRTESFWVLMLDSRGRPLGTACVGEGTLTACLVHPREVFAPAIRARAASIIVVHNHPSGDPRSSDDDDELTRRLSEAGALLGIPLLDHVIVARGGFRSLSQAAGGAGERSAGRESRGRAIGA